MKRLTFVFRIASWRKPSAVGCEPRDLFRESPPIPFLFIKILSVCVPLKRIVCCGTFRFPDKGFGVRWCSRRIVILFIASLVPCSVFYRDLNRLPWKNCPRCFSCSVALYCGIFLLDQLQFSRQIFLERLWRFRNF